MIEKGYYDPAETLKNRRRYLYQDPEHDMPGKFYKEINPDETFTKYTYDLGGNVKTVTDPNGSTTTYQYDPLSRLVSATQPGNFVTSYDYDGHGNLKTVTDAEFHTTTYQYDDMGRLVSTTSPDTGTVTYVYDEAGNPVGKTDQKAITVTYVYDFLNRLGNVSFPDPAQNVGYTYDTGTNGMGRRTGMTDPSGSTTFGYDNRGRLHEKTSVINGHSHALSRSFTPAGRVADITYPSGRQVAYQRNDCACNVSGITTTPEGGSPTTLASYSSYRPFGAPTGMSSAGDTVQNLHDLSGRLWIANPDSLKERTYAYDANGNLTTVSSPGDPVYSRTYVYDALNRLTHAEGPYGMMDYTYDRVGNRLTRVENGVTETYTYVPNTNRIAEITGPDPVSFTHDANGNITGIGGKILTYNQDNRLVKVEQ